MADHDKDIAAKTAADAKESAKRREERLRAERKAADEDTKAHYERANASQPTPTQEENDRAKLGFHSVEELDEKEDDGSPEQRDIAPAAAAPYTTRDAAAKK